MDKRKWSKFVAIHDDDHDDSKSKEKEILIERRDEFGRIMTPKEAFRMISHKFHGKGPGKKKQEKRMKQLGVAKQVPIHDPFTTRGYPLHD